MDFIEDILRIVRKGPQTLRELSGVNINTKSVAAGASDATLQFPCLVSDTNPIDRATCIARSLERVYASFTQDWLSLHPVIDITVDRTPIDYLKRFHQNVKLESDISDLAVAPEDLEDYMEHAYRGEYKLYTSKDGSYGILFNVADKETAALMESNRALLKEHLSEFNLTPVYEANEDDSVAADLVRAAIEGNRGKKQDKETNTTVTKYDKMKTPTLLDRDVKKSNDMVPYAMQVRLMAVNDAGQFVQYMDFIVGVKTVLHVIKSDEILENIERALQNKSVFFKFLRWTTGEISLIKNIILDLDSIKFDAMHGSEGRSAWFPRLKQLKQKKLGIHSLTVPHGIIPNASLVISSYEANWLNSHGIDIRDPQIARKVIDSLFLMTFIIIDDSTETVDILYNNSTAYETYALETLEREVSMNSNKLGREIGRMISR